MRALEGHTSMQSPFLGNFGQASAVPALSATREVVGYNRFPHEYWGRFAVSNDGTKAVKIGQAVSNTPYYSFLPTDDIHVTLVGWAGTDAGKVMYVPVSSFLAEYGVLTPPEEEIVRALPNPAVVPNWGYKKFYEDGDTAFSLAVNALSNAKLGDTKTALARLDAKGAGARGLRDAASVDLRELEDIGFFTRDEGMGVRLAVLQPLSDLINEATRTIGRSQSAILSLYDGATELWKLTGAQLRGFAMKVLEKNLNLYKRLYELNSAVGKLIPKMEAFIAIGGDKDGKLAVYLEGFKKDYAELSSNLAKANQIVINGGIPIDEWKKEAGLGEIGAAIAAAFVAAIGFAMWQLLEGVSNQLTMTYKNPRPGIMSTYIPDTGLHGLIARLFVSEAEMKHRMALAGEGPDATTYLQVANECKTAIGLAGKGSRSYLDGAKEAYPESVDDNAIENIRNYAEQLGLGGVSASPWPYIGAIAGGLSLAGLIRFLVLRKKEV